MKQEHRSLQKKSVMFLTDISSMHATLQQMRSTLPLNGRLKVAYLSILPV